MARNDTIEIHGQHCLQRFVPIHSTGPRRVVDETTALYKHVACVDYPGTDKLNDDIPVGVSLAEVMRADLFPTKKNRSGLLESHARQPRLRLLNEVFPRVLVPQNIR